MKREKSISITISNRSKLTYHKYRLKFEAKLPTINDKIKLIGQSLLAKDVSFIKKKFNQELMGRIGAFCNNQKGLKDDNIKQILESLICGVKELFEQNIKTQSFMQSTNDRIEKIEKKLAKQDLSETNIMKQVQSIREELQKNYMKNFQQQTIELHQHIEKYFIKEKIKHSDLQERKIIQGLSKKTATEEKLCIHEYIKNIEIQISKITKKIYDIDEQIDEMKKMKTNKDPFHENNEKQTAPSTVKTVINTELNGLNSENQAYCLNLFNKLKLNKLTLLIQQFSKFLTNLTNDLTNSKQKSVEFANLLSLTQHDKCNKQKNSQHLSAPKRRARQLPQLQISIIVLLPGQQMVLLGQLLQINY